MNALVRVAVIVVLAWIALILAVAMLKLVVALAVLAAIAAGGIFCFHFVRAFVRRATQPAPPPQMLN